jgi:hypothetical protein
VLLASARGPGCVAGGRGRVPVVLAPRRVGVGEGACVLFVSSIRSCEWCAGVWHCPGRWQGGAGTGAAASSRGRAARRVYRAGCRRTAGFGVQGHAVWGPPPCWQAWAPRRCVCTAEPRGQGLVHAQACAHQAGQLHEKKSSSSSSSSSSMCRVGGCGAPHLGARAPPRLAGRVRAVLLSRRQWGPSRRIQLARQAACGWRPCGPARGSLVHVCMRVGRARRARRWVPARAPPFYVCLRAMQCV